jgi:nitronate monooxygenase
MTRVLPPVLQRVPFPVIASPMFIISNPKMVIAQCVAGVVGSMPALNARPAEQLEEWLIEITEALAANYTEATIKNPKATIYENMVRAVQSTPLVEAAPALLEQTMLFGRSLEYQIKVDVQKGDQEAANMKSLTLAILNGAIKQAKGQSS